MLSIYVPEQELYDPNKEEFYTVKGATLQLEHSLLSISKWESKWHKPFLENVDSRSTEEVLDYIRCMVINPNIDQRLLSFLTEEDIKQITDYINDPMTATWFSDDNNKNGKKKHEIITSEVIYYMMIAQNIPVEFQKWHINRLLTLIKVCVIKNEQTYGKSNKMSKSEILRSNQALNAKRRAMLHTKG